MVWGRKGVFSILLVTLGMNGGEPINRFYSQGNYIHPFQIEIKPTMERVTITSQKDETPGAHIERQGFLVRYPNARATIVIAHGFMCDKYDVGFIRQMFPKGKYNFLSFDFRAHGEDTKGQYCTFGRDEAYDVIAAAHFVRNHPALKKFPVYGYAFSMGAVASIEAQAKDPKLFDAMILDCPFDSSESVIKKAVESLKFSLFGYEFDMPGRGYLEQFAFHPYVQEFVKTILKTVSHMNAKNIQTYIHRFSPAESIKKVEVPCLFIHCKHDERISVSAIRNIYQGARGPKMLWVTNGRGHYDSLFYNPEKYADQVSSFFDRVMKGDINTMSLGEFEDSDDVRGMVRGI